MKVVIQRVSQATVSVNKEIIGKIGWGIVVLIGFSNQDTGSNTPQMVDKILNLNPQELLEIVVQEEISMCGVIPVTTMLLAAKELEANKATLIKYMTSGDVSGDFSNVVGYAGIVIN